MAQTTLKGTLMELVLSIKQIRKRTGLSIGYIRKKIRRGDWTKLVGAGGRVFVPKHEIDNYLIWRQERDERKAQRLQAEQDKVNNGIKILVLKEDTGELRLVQFRFVWELLYFVNQYGPIKLMERPDHIRQDLFPNVMWAGYL